MAPPEDSGGVEQRGWGEYRRHILFELERIGGDIRTINEKIERFRQEDLSQIKTDIALLKFQAAMYGAVAATIISGAVTLLFKFVK